MSIHQTESGSIGGWLSCQECDGAVEMTDDNGATSPDRTRVELYECATCGATGRLVLAASGGERKTGCLQ